MSGDENKLKKYRFRSRLDEMIVLLDQYTANGTYGQYFNSDEPSLRDDAKMVVLELGGLEDRPSLLVAVMFSLIIYIENRMYRTPRNLKNRPLTGCGDGELLPSSHIIWQAFPGMRGISCLPLQWWHRC